MTKTLFRLHIIFLGCLFAFSGVISCSAGGGLSGSKQMSERRKAALATQYRKFTMVPEYRFGYGDVIDVKFFNNSNFDESVRVRPDGRISLQKVGDIFVNGMTPSQLDSLVTTRYSELIINPEVTIIVREFGGYDVYVLGEVSRSGSVSLARNMTLLQAVASAGGPSDDAKMNNVMVLRRGSTGIVEAIRVDLTKPLQGQYGAIAQNDLFVQPQDIIYVPKTGFASTVDFLDQVWDGVLPPVDTYLRYLIFQERNNSN